MYSSMIQEKEKYFDYLLSSVKYCNLCDRMCYRKKVLSRHNGNLKSKVLFIAEAPGRLGAECTGIPLYGDRTGDNFETLLANIGWKREDVFVTNAILCNPQTDDGNNSTPTKWEIENCSYYLQMVVELVNPDVVVTLGVKALEALKSLQYHNYTLKNHVATELNWNNKKLFPLYHMGPRALIHRALLQQRADFIKLSHVVDPVKGLKIKDKKTSTTAASKINNHALLEMVQIILSELKTITFFKLNKLLYLIDYNFYKETGKSMSGSIYLRMQEGPWVPYLKDIVKEYDNEIFKTTFIRKKPILHYLNDSETIDLDSQKINYIKSKCEQYRNDSDAEIKIKVYLTDPMKYILRQEKAGRNMLKTPVLYKDSTVKDMDINK